MTETELKDFLILRNLEEPATETQFASVNERAGDVLQALTDEGVGIRWIKSDLRTQTDGKITGTFCQYQAENEAALYEHADRAGLPVTRIDLRGETLERGSR